MLRFGEIMVGKAFEMILSGGGYGVELSAREGEKKLRLAIDIRAYQENKINDYRPTKKFGESHQWWAQIFHAHTPSSLGRVQYIFHETVPFHSKTKSRSCSQSNNPQRRRDWRQRECKQMRDLQRRRHSQVVF